MSTHAGALLRATKIAISLLIIGAVIAAAALARTGGARHLAAEIGIRTVREPYTALSFADAAELGYHGVSYRGRQVHDRVRFIVANREHRRERYRWTISFAPHGRVYHGVVNVAAGGSAAVARRVLLPCARLTAGRHRPGPRRSGPHRQAPRRVGSRRSKPSRSTPAPRVQVRVHLQPSRETIDYWQVCGG